MGIKYNICMLCANSYYTMIVRDALIQINIMGYPYYFSTTLNKGP